MPKPTQAHLTESWSTRRPVAWKEMRKRKMEYYMGAKLIEVGINPKSAVYRWSVDRTDSRETWTCSAYWGESKDKLS